LRRHRRSPRRRRYHSGSQFSAFGYPYSLFSPVKILHRVKYRSGVFHLPKNVEKLDRNSQKLQSLLLSFCVSFPHWGLFYHTLSRIFRPFSGLRTISGLQPGFCATRNLNSKFSSKRGVSEGRKWMWHAASGSSLPPRTQALRCHAPASVWGCGGGAATTQNLESITAYNAGRQTSKGS